MLDLSLIYVLFWPFLSIKSINGISTWILIMSSWVIKPATSWLYQWAPFNYFVGSHYQLQSSNMLISFWGITQLASNHTKIEHLSFWAVLLLNIKWSVDFASAKHMGLPFTKIFFCCWKSSILKIQRGHQTKSHCSWRSLQGPQVSHRTIPQGSKEATEDCPSLVPI